MPECCNGFAITEFADLGAHHHRRCPKYQTEKFTYLFYYSDALDKWVKAPDHLPLIVDPLGLGVGDVEEVKFKRLDLTDEEFNNLPEE